MQAEEVIIELEDNGVIFIIIFKQRGKFKKINGWVQQRKEKFNLGILNQYGEAGVMLLENATPKDTGETARSWRYDIVRDSKNKVVKLQFHNVNMVNGISIALLIQNGHATGTGGWVEGRDYINPAIQPLFDDLVNKIWKEVKG